MRRQREREAGDAWNALQARYAGLWAQLLGFTREVYGIGILHEAWREFTLGEKAELPFDLQSPHLSLFMPWLLHGWAPACAAGTVTRDYFHYGVPPSAGYLDRQCRRIDPHLRLYLQKCLSTPFGFYEVVSCEPGDRLIVHDLLRNESVEVVGSRLDTETAPLGILFGQCIQVGPLGRFEAVSPLSIPADYRSRIIAHCLRLPNTGRAMALEALRERNRKLRELYFDIAGELLQPRMISAPVDAGALAMGSN